jgi:hypothetical protein
MLLVLEISEVPVEKNKRVGVALRIVLLSRTWHMRFLVPVQSSEMLVGVSRIHNTIAGSLYTILIYHLIMLKSFC